MKTKNKSFKRLFAFLVALVMVTALVPSVIFAADPTFTDVKSTDWFYEHVENLAANGIVSGYKGTKEFKPNNPVTRQEAAKMIALGAKTPAASGTEFTDLLGNWADPYIMALEADGAVSGFAGTKEFKPLENIKRGHVAKMIALAFGLKEGSEDYDLTDIKGVDNEEYIKILASNGIVGGFKGTTLFKPNELVTRAQMAKMIDVAMSPVDSTFRVVDVRAINGKEVEIEFNKVVDEATVVDASDNLLNITFTKVGTAPAVTSSSAGATLSEDGKTLTVVPQTTEFFNGDYAVLVPVAVEDVDENPVEAYSAIVSLKDSARPTVVGVTYPINGVARVTFSEPMNVANANAIVSALTIKNKLGVTIDSSKYTVTLAAGNKYFEINITDAAFVAKDVNTATLIGLKDYSGKLLTPNPSTFEIVKDTVDDIKPTVVNVESAGIGKAKITFSEKLSVYGTINGATITTGASGNATVDATGLVVTVETTAVPALSGTVLVTLAGYTDLSGNVGATFTKLVNFVADTTAPKYVSHEVVTIGADQYLLVKYDENVKLATSLPLPTNALTGTYVDANSVTKTMTPIVAANASQHLVGSATTTDTIKIKITGIPAGNYTATVDGGLVSDLANNNAAAKTVTFSFGTYLDPTVPVATIGAVQTEEDKVVVTYNIDVTAATALNTANYKVEGVEVFESAIFSGDQKTVHLKLAPNSFALAGDRLFTISNVQTAAGKVMTPVSEIKNFKANVKPVLEGARFGSGTTIIAEFSSTLSAGSANAFEVYKDGVKLTTGVSATAASAGSDEVTITVPTITIGSVYEVKFIGTDFKDQATPANAVVTGTTVTVTN